MTISSPVTLPTTPAPRSIEITPLSAVGVTESPFTYEQEVQVHQGERWTARIEYAPFRTRALAEDLIGALVSLNGREHTLLVRAYPRSTRGTIDGGTVNGGGQTGKTLTITGANAAATAKRGDRFQLGSYLYMVTKDVTLDALGAGTLDIWPRLRGSPAHGAALTVNDPAGLFRLQPPFSWSLDVGMVYGLSLSLIEAL